MKRPYIKCPYCGSQAFLRPASVLGKTGPSYVGKEFYVCGRYPRCNSYVAAHTHSRLPMGTLADPALRRKRHDAHLMFDRLWKEGYMTIDGNCLGSLQRIAGQCADFLQAVCCK